MNVVQRFLFLTLVKSSAIIVQLFNYYYYRGYRLSNIVVTCVTALMSMSLLLLLCCCWKFTQLLMVWKVASLLPAGNNKLLFASADHRNAHLWRIIGMPSPQWFSGCLSISGIVTGTPTTTGKTFVLTLHIFPTSLARSWYFSSFSSSFSLTLTSSGIAAPIICWWWWQWWYSMQQLQLSFLAE